MDMFHNFTGGNSTSTPAKADPSSNNPTVPGDSTSKSDGTGPVAFPNTDSNTGDKSPLAGFEDLWKTADTDAKTPSSLVPDMKVDGTAIMKAASQVDFTKGISPEIMQKALSGDVSAFGQAINSAAQTAFAHSTATTAKIVEQALKKQEKVFTEEVMPNILRQERINSSISQENPIFENPAVSPMLTIVKERLSQKFPNASPSEISAKAKDYLSGFANEYAQSQGKTFADLPKKDASTQLNGEDWGKFFGL